MPACQNEFEDLNVEYMTLTGWKSDISQVRSFDELPDQAKEYVRQIEKLLDVPGVYFLLLLLLLCNLLL